MIYNTVKYNLPLKFLQIKHNFPSRYILSKSRYGLTNVRLSIDFSKGYCYGKIETCEISLVRNGFVLLKKEIPYNYMIVLDDVE